MAYDANLVGIDYEYMSIVRLKQKLFPFLYKHK
ncbi:hypothetical protein SAMN05216261_1219 [Algibacter luteus]|jgi:hypothetical protein|uniref:Uncharacterized protein n=1 Tax=Algibacter luteus TaxID=1178825 RepID=A0A1M6CF60_9FLAO|nr:hypothetical protein SAMN05216261_1219 [Algibacter luteus]